MDDLVGGEFLGSAEKGFDHDLDAVPLPQLRGKLSCCIGSSRRAAGTRLNPRAASVAANCTPSPLDALVTKDTSLLGVAYDRIRL